MTESIRKRALIIAAVCFALTMAVFWMQKDLRIAYTMWRMQRPASPDEYCVKAEDLAAHGPDVVEHLIPWLEDPHSWKELVASMTLPALGDEAVDEGIRLVETPGTPSESRAVLITYLGYYRNEPRVRDCFERIMRGTDAKAKDSVRLTLRFREHENPRNTSSPGKDER